jgi:thiol-disulfide isomerase/thioredoxin
MCKILPLLLFAAFGYAGGKAFLDIPLETALKRAEVEKKYVFIDFYTDWCAPCKLMTRTTFQDEKVLIWLNEHAISLSLNAEVHVEIAKKYEVKAYPTLVFLKPDGQIAHSFTGYRDPTRFLGECYKLLTGKAANEEGEEVSNTDLSEFRQSLNNVKNLIASGKNDEACEILKKLLAEANRDPIHEGTRANTIYRSLQSCKTPAAQEILNAEYERIYGLLKVGQVNRISIFMFFTLSKMTHGKSLLTVYDELKATGTSSESLAYFSGPVFQEMLDAQRYAEAEALESVEKRLADIDLRIARGKSGPLDRQALLNDYTLLDNAGGEPGRDHLRRPGECGLSHQKSRLGSGMDPKSS